MRAHLLVIICRAAGALLYCAAGAVYVAPQALSFTNILTYSSHFQVEWDHLTSIITQKTCVNMRRFVRANHTYACALPGVALDARAPVDEDMRLRSCKVDDFRGMRGVSLERVSFSVIYRKFDCLGYCLN